MHIPNEAPRGKLKARVVIDGKLKAPSGFAIGPDGDLYVAERFDQCVRRFAIKGKKGARSSRDSRTCRSSGYTYRIRRKVTRRSWGKSMRSLVSMRVLVSECMYATLILALLAAGTATAAPGVLILHSNQRPTAAQVVIEDHLRTVVFEGFKPVQLFSEFLDDEWASLEAYGPAEAGFLRNKYSQRDIRVIVAVALPALQFAAKFRDQMFPGLPVVHIAVAKDRLDQLALPKDIVGSTENHDPTPTVQLAQRLHPNATRLVVVRGASQLDRLWDVRVRAAVERVGNDFEVEYLSGLPTAEVLRRVGSLPRQARRTCAGNSVRTSKNRCRPSRPAAGTTTSASRCGASLAQLTNEEIAKLAAYYSSFATVTRR